MATLSKEYDEYLSNLKLKPENPYYQIVKKGKSFLNVGGKHIYTIQLGANKIVKEDQYKKTQVLATLDKVANNRSLTGYLSNFARAGSSHFQRYSNAGKRYYKHHTPEVAIITEGVSSEVVKAIIEKEIQSSITVDDYTYVLLEPEDWCKYQLQQLYGYDIAKDVLEYNGKYYDFSQATITAVDNTYKCVLKSISSFSCVTEIHKEIEVINKNSTTDTVNTYEITVKHFYRASDDEFIYTDRTQTLKSTKDVTKGSVAEDYYTVSGSTTVVNDTVSTFTKTVTGYNTFQPYYLVRYTDINTFQSFYWIYNPKTGVYPELKNAKEFETSEVMFPTTVIRDNFKYVTDEELEASEKMLNAIGLDFDTLKKGMDENKDIDKVMDCFIVLGVSPSEETDPTVSKVLYDTAEHVYDTVGLRAGAPYNVTFKQDMYNSTAVWTATAPIERKENIMPVGTCAHTSGYQTVTTTYYMICNATKTQQGSYWFKADVRARVVCETSTEAGVLSRRIVKTVFYKNLMFDRFEFEDPYAEGSWISPSTIQGTRDGRVLIPISYQVASEPDEEGAVSYYTEYRDFITKLVFDNSDCISNIITESEPTKHVVLMITKQIDKLTTRTHTLMDFIGNYSISHPKGVSVIPLNGKNPELVIPILKKVYNRLSVIDKTKLLDNALYLQNYAYDHQYLRWYQTAAFGALLQVAGIVILIYSMGTAANVTAALWALAKAIVIAVGISLALELIAKYTDGFIQAVLSGAAIAVGVALNGGFTNFGFMDVCLILNTSVEAFNLYVGEQMTELQSAMASFSSAAEVRLEDISKAWEDLKQIISAEDYMGIVINKVDAMLDAPLSMRTNTGLVEELTFFSKYNNPTEVWLQEVHTTPADKLHF